MADNDKLDTPPSGTEFTAAVPLSAAKSPSDDAPDAGTGQGPSPASYDDDRSFADASPDALRDHAQRFAQQAQDKARDVAEDGKARASEALHDVVRMMNDAAATVDEKVGPQYGRYARSAADYVDGLAQSLDAKEIDDLVTDVRGLVQKSPAIAIGTAAAVGFALARIVRSGIDADRHDA